MKKLNKTQWWITILSTVLIAIILAMCVGTFYIHRVYRTHQIQHMPDIPAFICVFSILIIILLFILNCFYRRMIHASEAEIRHREQLFDILAKNTQDVFLILNYSDFKVTYVSPNIEHVLGIRPETVKADLRVLGTLSNKHSDIIDYHTLHSIEPNGSLVREGQRIHKGNGEQLWFVETVYRSGTAGHDRLIVLFSDQTAKWRNEYTMSEALDLARAANEATSTFFSNMSHDIRIPMNSIVGLATLLQRDANHPEQVIEHAHKITAASQHLLCLLNDVLNMSKIENGRTRLNIGKINLAEIVDELTTIMQPQAKAKRQNLEILLEEITSEHLLGDHLRISQILINILSNAIKYTPVDGYIKMTVQELPQIANNLAHLRFTIKDNGPDMSEEYQTMIFQPLSREPGYLLNRMQGTDLGMAITKNLIDLMGGTLEVISSQTEGTTFTVDLELSVQEQYADNEFHTKYGIENMLLIDDDEITCLSVINAMKGTNVTTHYALSGSEAIAKIDASTKANRPFDLILLDWKMPEMDGLETARQIRKLLPPNVPIIILTSYDWTEIEEKSLNDGISGFLSKPFFLSTFKYTLQTIWEKQKLEKKPIGKPKSILKGKHILVAEDNEMNAEILTELLDILEADCEVAINGQQTLELFQNSEPGHFDLILMDVQMPVMDGYEATKIIRNGRHPQAATIPIIAMTANAFTDDIIDALAAGMDAHVSKPVDLAHLETVAGEILAKKK